MAFSSQSSTLQDFYAECPSCRNLPYFSGLGTGTQAATMFVQPEWLGEAALKISAVIGNSWRLCRVLETIC